MDFDISKLETTQDKATEKKSKPRFGPAARARPKAQVKPARAPEQAEPVAAEASQPAGPSQEDLAAADNVNGNDGDLQAANQADNTSQPAAVAAPSAETAPVQQPSNAGRKFKPALGKRKAAEPAAADAAAEPSQQAPDANQQGALAMVPTANAAENTADDADEAGPSTGPMTKAKKRKGLGKGSAAAPKPAKVPLAEQTIDPATMPMGTIAKCAMARSRQKVSAEQAAREAAGLSPGQGSRQQPSRAPRAEPAVGAIQVELDEHGGWKVNEASRTMQAQPQVEYTRREDGQHDVINSMTYMKREASSRWSAEETEEFYAALAIWGTNFNYVATRINTRMAALGVPHAARSRRQVKLKFNKEEKLHPRKIDRALKGQRAEAEDYVEIIHELKAQNQEEEMAYLEAAPSSKSEPANDIAADTDRQGNASAMQEDGADNQAAQQAAAPPVSASGPKQDTAPQKNRPHAKPRPQAAQQKAALANESQDPLQQQESEPEEGPSRFTQMLQESGVTVADWQEEGVY